MARAAAVGDTKAAEEFKVAQATIRSWRRRVKAEPAETQTPGPSTLSEPNAPGEAEAPLPTGASGINGMRRARDAARAVEAQAVEQTLTLLAAGQAREAQAASIAGGVWSDKALNLDKALAAAEAERVAEAVRLKEATLELQASVLRKVFEAVGLPVPVTSMRVLAEQASRGEPLEVPEEIATPERERMRVKVRAERLEELLAGGWRPPGAEGENAPGGEGEQSDDDGDPEEVDTVTEQPAGHEVTLEQVRAEFRNRFPGQPETAIVEERRQRIWEGTAGDFRAQGRSRWPDFSHPGLRGGA